MAWLQLSVKVSGGQVEKTIEILEQLGSQATMQQNAGEDSYFDLAHPAEPGWDRQRVTGLFEDDNNAEQLSSMLMGALSFVEDIEVTRLEDQNWETTWLDQYQPIEITPDLWVYPGWVEVAPDIGTVIKIDPGMAFGTGTHETTRLCMKVLSEQPIIHKTVLDYGCGSGILAITALALGAGRAIGVDVDSKAEIVSQENARINGVDERFTIQSAKAVEGQKFDIVMANILAYALIDLATKLGKNAHRNGIIILSGILEGQADDVIKAYQLNFKFEKFQDGAWVVLLGYYKN